MSAGTGDHRVGAQYQQEVAKPRHLVEYDQPIPTVLLQLLRGDRVWKRYPEPYPGAQLIKEFRWGDHADVRTGVADAAFVEIPRRGVIRQRRQS